MRPRCRGTAVGDKEPRGHEANTGSGASIRVATRKPTRRRRDPSPSPTSPDRQPARISIAPLPTHASGGHPCTRSRRTPARIAAGPDADGRGLRPVLSTIAIRLRGGVRGLLWTGPILGGMSGMEPQDVRRLSRLFLLAFPVLVFAVDFLAVLVSFVLLSLIMPNVLGKVAKHPGLYAVMIALTNLPLQLIYMTAVSWRGWVALVTRGEFLDPPAPKGWRRFHIRVRDYAAQAAAATTAALIVLNYLMDPGEVHLWLLATLTAVVPILLPLPLKGLVWLIRRWWRSRPSYRPRHAVPSAAAD